jgi:hypothetical protein
VNDDQGCQIILSTKYQNREKYTKVPQNKRIVHDIFQIARLSEIYPNSEFWSEIKSSGSPDDDLFFLLEKRFRTLVHNGPIKEDLYTEKNPLKA